MNTESKEIAPLQEFRGTIDRMGDQFMAALPAHITADKFKRTVITAVTMNPDLLDCDRRSLLASCMKAASDGLLLDNRDAALVKFGREVQYMPMIGGILKRMRQSGDIKAVCSDVVHDNDEFDYWTDENGKHLTHRPNKGDRGEITHAYAIVNTTDGGIYIEVMDRPQIEKVRNVSKAKGGGPWTLWFDQMARKTVLRRLSKSAPMSTDIADLLRRDDDQYDLNQAATVAHIHDGKPATRPRALESIAAPSAPATQHEESDDAPASAGEAVVASGGSI